MLWVVDSHPIKLWSDLEDGTMKVPPIDVGSVIDQDSQEQFILRFYYTICRSGFHVLPTEM